jgi:flavin-dependent dehydrogenase
MPNPESNGVLMAGDAAAFVDPFIGDGISLALLSGSLAAQALASFLLGQSSLEESTQTYCEAYQQQLMPVFHTSANIRALFRLPKPVRTGLLHLFGNIPALTRYLVRKTRSRRGGS